MNITKRHLAMLFFVITGVLEAGCSPLLTGKLDESSDERVREVAARRPPAVRLGAEIPLIENPADASTSIVTSDGHVHIFTGTSSGHLYHLEVDGDTVIASTQLGVVEISDPLGWIGIDAVEYPRGQLRVLAGDRQFVIGGPGIPPLEIQGNRCARFIPHGEKLFCAFIVAGKEVGAPVRKDYVVGFFILLPVVAWDTKEARKLAIAEETPQGWVIRAVLDPDTDLDADEDFAASLTDEGLLHIDYFTSRGGFAFYVVVAPMAGGSAGGAPTSMPRWRHAEVNLKTLAADEKVAPKRGGTDTISPNGWRGIEGNEVLSMPFAERGSSQEDHLNRERGLRPLNRRFVLGPDGNGIGLVWEQTRYPWIEVRKDGSVWKPEFQILATNGLPKEDSEWFHDPQVVFKTDRQGNEHAVLNSCSSGFWEVTCSLEYFHKGSVGWSAPIRLGYEISEHNACRSLAVAPTGDAFATWINKQGKLVGRWLRKL